MNLKSLKFLRCPQPKADARCSGQLRVDASHRQVEHPIEKTPIEAPRIEQELIHGQLRCEHCDAIFPVIAGVAVLLESPEDYLFAHLKGIAPSLTRAEVSDLKKKKFYRKFLIEIESELDRLESPEAAEDHIEEDLESVRVNALYFMNHYLKVSQVADRAAAWWVPAQEKRTTASSGSPSPLVDPLIDQLIRKYWDQGPLAQIGKWAQASTEFAGKTLELGCGVGGLATAFRKSAGTYLGVDMSFASIALARQVQLGVGRALEQKIPTDLLQGTVSEKVSPAPLGDRLGEIEFVVGTLSHPPVDSEAWDLSISCNAIDMLERPADLPEVQFDVLRSGGHAVQSGPYIWHSAVATELRAETGVQKDSAAAVEQLYRSKGFVIETVENHVPWLFLKHARQLEVYSVHWFTARKA